MVTYLICCIAIFIIAVAIIILKVGSFAIINGGNVHIIIAIFGVYQAKFSLFISLKVLRFITVIIILLIFNRHFHANYWLAIRSVNQLE